MKSIWDGTSKPTLVLEFECHCRGRRGHVSFGTRSAEPGGGMEGTCRERPGPAISLPTFRASASPASLGLHPPLLHCCHSPRPDDDPRTRVHPRLKHGIRRS